MIKTWEYATYYVNAILSYIFNLVLIYLIVFHSRKSLGSYRLLLFSFATFDIIYPTIQLIVFPQLHNHRHAFIFFPAGWFRYQMFWGHVAMCIYAACVCLSITLLVFHFLYRYCAVCKNHWLFLFDLNRYRVLLFGIYILSGAAWFSFCYLLVPTKELKDYVGQNLMQTYGVDMEVTPVMGPLYFTEYNRTRVPYLRGIIGVGGCSIILTSSFACIFFCSYHIITILNTTVLMSEKTKKLQMELFKALCVQTLIPTLLEFIPCAVCFLAPIFLVPLNQYCNYVVIALCSYPVLDPLCIIYMVKDYRHGFYKICKFNAVASFKISSTPQLPPPSTLSQSAGQPGQIYSITKNNS